MSTFEKNDLVLYQGKLAVVSDVVDTFEQSGNYKYSISLIDEADTGANNVSNLTIDSLSPALAQDLTGFESDQENDTNKLLNLQNVEEDVQTPHDTPPHDATTSSSTRFVHVNNLDEMEQGRLSQHTVKMTQWGVRIFQEWLRETGKPLSFEGLETAELADLLRQFYAEIRSKRCSHYSKSALFGVRSAIHRHITSPPYSRKINILQDREFQQANNMLKSMVKTIRKEGKDISKHHQSIDPEDASKLRIYFSNIDTPRKLQQKVFYDLMLHFGRRGREGLRDMTKASFEVALSPSGSKYVTLRYNEADKNHDGFDGNEKAQMMFQQAGEPLCPVQSYENYVSHLNPKCTAFWQTPRPDNAFNEAVMYKNTPMGINTLQNMMSTIGKAAELSRRYTNHCLRATVATALNTAGVEREEIKLVTGHKNSRSLDSYISQPSAAKREKLSKMVFDYGKKAEGINNQQETCTNAVSPVENDSTTQNSNTSTALSYQHQAKANLATALLSGANFSGPTNITINFN